jgi:hypothetical protein
MAAHSEHAHDFYKPAGQFFPVVRFPATQMCPANSAHIDGTICGPLRLMKRHRAVSWQLAPPCSGACWSHWLLCSAGSCVAVLGALKNALALRSGTGGSRWTATCARCAAAMGRCVSALRRTQLRRGGPARPRASTSTGAAASQYLIPRILLLAACVHASGHHSRLLACLIATTLCSREDCKTREQD